MGLPISYPINPGDRPDSPKKICEIDKSLRPREKFMTTAIGDITDEVLLAILLRSGLPGKNVVDLAHEILTHFNGLEKLAQVDFRDMLAAGIKGLGQVKAMELSAAMELGRRLVRLQMMREAQDSLNNPASVYALMAARISHLQQESFWVLLLDVKNHLMGQPQEVARGSLVSTQVYPREVFKLAVRFSAASVLFVHNHPSGDPYPSEQDIKLTRRLMQCGELFGIPVIDHVVIGKQRRGEMDKEKAERSAYFSFRQERLMEKIERECRKEERERERKRQ